MMALHFRQPTSLRYQGLHWFPRHMACVSSPGILQTYLGGDCSSSHRKQWKNSQHCIRREFGHSAPVLEAFERPNNHEWTLTQWYRHCMTQLNDPEAKVDLDTLATTLQRLAYIPYYSSHNGQPQVGYDKRATNLAQATLGWLRRTASGITPQPTSTVPLGRTVDARDAFAALLEPRVCCALIANLPDAEAIEITHLVVRYLPFPPTNTLVMWMVYRAARSHDDSTIEEILDCCRGHKFSPGLESLWPVIEQQLDRGTMEDLLPYIKRCFGVDCLQDIEKPSDLSALLERVLWKTELNAPISRFPLDDLEDNEFNLHEKLPSDIKGLFYNVKTFNARSNGRRRNRKGETPMPTPATAPPLFGYDDRQSRKPESSSQRLSSVLLHSHERTGHTTLSRHVAEVVSNKLFSYVTDDIRRWNSTNQSDSLEVYRESVVFMRDRFEDDQSVITSIEGVRYMPPYDIKTDLAEAKFKERLGLYHDLKDMSGEIDHVNAGNTRHCKYESDKARGILRNTDGRLWCIPSITLTTQWLLSRNLRKLGRLDDLNFLYWYSMQCQQHLGEISKEKHEPNTPTDQSTVIYNGPIRYEQVRDVIDSVLASTGKDNEQKQEIWPNVIPILGELITASIENAAALLTFCPSESILSEESGKDKLGTWYHLRAHASEELIQVLQRLDRFIDGAMEHVQNSDDIERNHPMFHNDVFPSVLHELIHVLSSLQVGESIGKQFLGNHERQIGGDILWDHEPPLVMDENKEEIQDMCETNILSIIKLLSLWPKPHKRTHDDKVVSAWWRENGIERSSAEDEEMLKCLQLSSQDTSSIRVRNVLRRSVNGLVQKWTGAEVENRLNGDGSLCKITNLGPSLSSLSKLVQILYDGTQPVPVRPVLRASLSLHLNNGNLDAALFCYHSMMSSLNGEVKHRFEPRADPTANISRDCTVIRFDSHSQVGAMTQKLIVQIPFFVVPVSQQAALLYACLQECRWVDAYALLLDTLMCSVRFGISNVPPEFFRKTDQNEEYLVLEEIVWGFHKRNEFPSATQFLRRILKTGVGEFVLQRVNDDLERDDNQGAIQKERYDWLMREFVGREGEAAGAVCMNLLGLSPQIQRIDYHRSILESTQSIDEDNIIES